MRIQFDKDQKHQLEAIDSVLRLFEGQFLRHSEFEFSVSDNFDGSIKYDESGIGNRLSLTETQLLKNLQMVQEDNVIYKGGSQSELQKLRFADKSEADFVNYSIEMETGTGKTYVYLRTIYELNKTYGYKKFVVVVPSVAIREGVLKTLEITHEHFQELYEREPLFFRSYDSGKWHELLNFAKSSAIEILVINIDAFAKDSNIINQIRESGLRPVENIQRTRPIVILDEPQNMESEIRKRAIANLSPLFVLRYSATHRNPINLAFKLDPVKAYDLGLVKEIEVDSVVTHNEGSGATIALEGFQISKNSLAAKLRIYVNGAKGLAIASVNVKTGQDLYLISKGYYEYQNGYIVNKIDAEEQYIELSNGRLIYKGGIVSEFNDQILMEMVDATVENHFRKQLQLKELGIKVLSIFFIDKVNNYRTYNEDGTTGNGKFARWFEDSYRKWSVLPKFKGLIEFEAEKVHGGYFSQDKGKLKDSKEGKPSKADDDTYRLIMRDKERLLDAATPLRFIFSHSALREGWDNPNVFQICTLNETKSELKKRQEIGRGLRLCVDADGNRNLNRINNRLTIIANESFAEFSKALQSEIEEDCGVSFSGRIKNARERVNVKLKEKWLEDNLFIELWDKIKFKTRYQVEYDTETLISNCVEAIALMPFVERPTLHRERTLAKFLRNEAGDLTSLDGDLQSAKDSIIKNVLFDIPDIIGYIKSKTELTRGTITEILKKSNRVKEIFNNPQLFMDAVVRIIKTEFQKIKVAGIRYEKIAGEVYEMKLFESAEIEQYLDNLVPVQKANKTLYNYTAIDSLSGPELQFAKDCETSEDILFYTKLPREFAIKTPIGNYNPDWAVIKTNDEETLRIYFVAETKDTTAVKDDALLRTAERLKIACAKKHFEVIDKVKYQVVSSAVELSF